LERGLAVSFLGIYKSDFRYCEAGLPIGDSNQLLKTERSSCTVSTRPPCRSTAGSPTPAGETDTPCLAVSLTSRSAGLVWILSKGEESILIKKKTKFAHIKGNQKGLGAKANMTNGLLIYV
jgi:hypothetical protein